MKWDVFISHASEDKADVARPLADLLEQGGLRVWFDETEFRLGDSIRAKIEQGLVQSTFGIVIVSPTYLAKAWPQRELDGLMALETPERKVILPVWHRVDYADVAKGAPMLASKFAVSTNQGIEPVAEKILGDVFYFRGLGVFDSFHPTDREWFKDILGVFSRPAWRGKYSGWTGQEGYDLLMKSTTKTLYTGLVDDPSGTPKNIGSINQIKDSKLRSTMLQVADLIKRIDILVSANLPYPGASGPAIVDEINQIRDDVITRLNLIWQVFGIHTLPVPSQDGAGSRAPGS